MSKKSSTKSQRQTPCHDEVLLLVRLWTGEQHNPYSADPGGCPATSPLTRGSAPQNESDAVPANPPSLFFFTTTHVNFFVDLDIRTYRRSPRGASS